MMRAQITDKSSWVCVDSHDGTDFIPLDVVKPDWSKFNPVTVADCEQFVTAKIIDVDVVDGYGARLSMPGYMDCTEWIVCDTAAEAAQELLDAYFDGDIYENQEAQDEIEWLESIVKGQ